MKALLAMIGTALGAWALATAIAPVAINPDALLGVLGPLLSAGVSWVVAERTFRAAPERLTGVMVMGFAAKAVFFAGYLVVVMRGLGLSSMVFVVSFVSAFIVLHLIEAVSLKRLFATAHVAVQA
jgi:hypothetical protein